MGNKQLRAVGMVETKEELLKHLVFTTKEIARLFNYTEVDARAIKKTAITKFGGAVAMNKHAVTADAVFKAVNPNLDRSKEITIIETVETLRQVIPSAFEKRQ